MRRIIRDVTCRIDDTTFRMDKDGAQLRNGVGRLLEIRCDGANCRDVEDCGNVFGRDGNLTHQGAFESVGVDLGEGRSEIVGVERNNRYRDVMQVDRLLACGSLVNKVAECVEVIVIRRADIICEGMGVGVVVSVCTAKELRANANVLEESEWGFERVGRWQSRMNLIVDEEEHVVRPWFVVLGAGA